MGNDDRDYWHPSGRTPVYDRAMNLVGHTTLRIEVEYLRLTRRDGEGFQFVGVAKRILLERGETRRYWAYWVHEGDPADMPEFTRIRF